MAQPQEAPKELISSDDEKLVGAVFYDSWEAKRCNWQTESTLKTDSIFFSEVVSFGFFSWYDNCWRTESVDLYLAVCPLLTLLIAAQNRLFRGATSLDGQKISDLGPAELDGSQQHTRGKPWDTRAYLRLLLSVPVHPLSRQSDQMRDKKTWV